MVYLDCCKETQVQFPLHDTGRKDPLVGTFFGCCRVLDERGHNSIPDHTLCKKQQEEECESDPLEQTVGRKQ